MTCQQVQTNLSLYLYGELDFGQEEEVEQHLSGCAFCQRALGREKEWHTVLNSQRMDVPLDLLAECRRELRNSLTAFRGEKTRRPWFPRPWFRWVNSLGFSATRWSMRVALASLLVMIGFSAGRWIDRNGMAGSELGGTSNMGLLSGPGARIRDIQASDNGGVRIIVDQVRTREITGRAEDDDVRQLLLAAMRDPSDPGIRVDSAEILKGQDGADVRDALLYSVRHDANAAVRLKALEGLRGFSADSAARDTLKFVLEHDGNPEVRSEAIDVLAPAGRPVSFNPELALTLQQVMRSEREDDYVRMRCMQLLAGMKASLDIY